MEWWDWLPESPFHVPRSTSLLPPETLHPFAWTAVSTRIGENAGARAPGSNMDNSIRAKSAQSENASKTLKKLPSGPGKHVIFQTTHSISVLLSTNLALCPPPPHRPPPRCLAPFPHSLPLHPLHGSVT